MFLLAALMSSDILSANAHVQDYQIIRLLTYKTECQIDELKTLPPVGTSLRYFASCDNVTFYPEGITIVCSDPDDDRSCHVTTRPQTFDQLHALDRNH